MSECLITRRGTVGGNGFYAKPSLNPNYPQDASIEVLKGNTKNHTLNVFIIESGNPDEYEYQWYKDNEPIEGGNSSTYTYTASTSGTYYFYCTVSNAAGIVISKIATITVDEIYTPILSENYPADVNTIIIRGNTTSATFNVGIATAGNPANYTYRWYVNGTIISDNDSSTYTKSDLSSSGTYEIYCTVTNNAGTVTSRTATLTVEEYYTPELNTAYPENLTLITGTNAIFRASILNDGNPTDYTYQWYINDTAIGGANSSTYTRDTFSDKGIYYIYCKVTNAAGTVQTRTSTLTVSKLPILSTDYPVDSTVISGSNATFNISISSAGYPESYTYQWYVNDSPINGATSDNYTRSTLNDAGVYTVYCKVSNAAGTVQSKSATLTVNKTPVLNESYPTDATFTAGGSTTLTVVVETAGYPINYTYQWYTNDTLVEGATSSTYEFTNDTLGTYHVYCKVSNSAGTVTSRTATITAEPYYLLRNGIIDSNNLVGFNASSTDGNGTGEYAGISYKDGYIHTYAVAVSNSSVYRDFTSKVNLPSSKYNTLCLDMEGSLNYDTQAVSLGGCQYNPSSSFSRTVKRINISSLTSDYPLILIARAWSIGTRECHIYYYNIWLE